MIDPRDFSRVNKVPGVSGNPFDILLHKMERIQDIPFYGIFCALFIIALLGGGFSLISSGILFGFFILDWILLLLLPRSNRSFGPEKPTLLLLAILRLIFYLLISSPYNISLQIFGTILVFYSFWIEPFRLTITRMNYANKGRPTGSSIRMLHLGDLHIERLTRREKRILDVVKKEKPDIILFSGDILNLSYLHDSLAIKAAREFFFKLGTESDVFLVSGSPAVDLPDMLPKILENLPVTWLRNSAKIIPLRDRHIRLIGLDCSHRPDKDAELLHEIVTDLPADEGLLTIFLYHSPDLAPHAARMGIDIQLSGHTHGGQFRIPGFGPLFTGSLYGRVFQNGRYVLNNMVLYITRGIGMEGASAPRMRFFCPPEIIIWDID